VKYQKLKIIPLLPLLALITVGCSNSAKDIKDSREGANTFHAYFRAQNYEAIYANSSQRFKNVRPLSEYVSMMKEIEGEYGKLVNVQEASSAAVVNTDAGKMQVLIFNLEFEKAKATERLTFSRDEQGQMRLWMFELS
jgi:hypothetical protein